MAGAQDKFMRLHNNFIISRTIGLAVIFLSIVFVIYATSEFKNNPFFSLRYAKSNIKYAELLFFNRNDKQLINTTETSETADAVMILLYHGINNNGDSFSITQDRFNEHMVALKREGYETITIEQLYDFLYNKKTLPKNSFLLTFDDGRKDSYYSANPILKLLNYRAVMYIATNFSISSNPYKSTYYLNPEELKLMISSGRWEIQSHAQQESGGFIVVDSKGSLGNFLSNKKWLTEKDRLETESEYRLRVENELIISQQLIESTLSQKVISLSFPFGDYGQQSLNNKKSLGVIKEIVDKVYPLAFYQIWPLDSGFLFNYPSEKGFRKRLEPKSDWSGEKLLETIKAGSPKKLPYIENWQNFYTWKTTMGIVSWSNRGAKIKATEGGNGFFFYIDGTYLWKNYSLIALVDWIHGSHISLVGQYFNESNFLSCTYSDGWIRIQEYINGDKIILANEKFSPISKKNMRLGMSVNNGSIKCYYNTALVAWGQSKTKNISGGVGMHGWDDQNTQPELLVKELQIKNN